MRTVLHRALRKSAETAVIAARCAKSMAQREMPPNTLSSFDLRHRNSPLRHATHISTAGVVSRRPDSTNLDLSMNARLV